MANSADSRPCRVYCAGPLFNQAERDEMTAIADSLSETGHPVYLPHRDGMEFRLVYDVLVERGWPGERAGAILHSAIFALDVYQLAFECGALVWNLNGRTPDEGAVSEAAIAWTLGKPLVAFTDDVRSLIQGRINPLLAGLVDFHTIDQIEEIPAALTEAIEHQETRFVSVADLPPKLRRIVEHGRLLWDSLSGGKGHFDDEMIADAVVDLFASAEETRAET